MRILMFQVEVFWVVTPCIVVVGYQSFGGPCCLHLQGDGRQHGSPKRWRPTTTLHGITTQKTSTSKNICGAFIKTWKRNFSTSTSWGLRKMSQY